MLDAMPARTVFQRFHTELFGIDRYANIQKNATLFPKFNATVAADLRTADVQLFDYVYAQGLGFKDLLLTPVAFVNQNTAPLYGMTATGTTFKQVMLGADRPGYFTRAGFLAYNGTLVDPDPIRRGVDVIRRVLGAANFAPPPGQVIPPLPEVMPGQTNRERVTAFTGKGTCGESCHGNYINPLGFAFENFDAMGQVRTMDNGKTLDTTGEYPFADGVQSFTGAPALLALLAAQAQPHQTYSANLAEFVLARDVAEQDRAFINTPWPDQHERELHQAARARHHEKPSLHDARYAMKNPAPNPNGRSHDQPARVPARRRRRGRRPAVPGGLPGAVGVRRAADQPGVRRSSSAPPTAWFSRARAGAIRRSSGRWRWGRSTRPRSRPRPIAAPASSPITRRACCSSRASTIRTAAPGAATPAGWRRP